LFPLVQNINSKFKSSTPLVCIKPEICKHQNLSMSHTTDSGQTTAQVQWESNGCTPQVTPARGDTVTENVDLGLRPQGCSKEADVSHPSHTGHPCLSTWNGTSGHFLLLEARPWTNTLIILILQSLCKCHQGLTHSQVRTERN
jgi:hypothetical protein